MSLLTSHSTVNKYTKTGLDIRYRHEVVDGGNLYTRYVTKAYEYVGMTYAAAMTCKAEKAAQYMRTHRRQEIEEVQTSASDGTVSTEYKVKEKSITERLCSISASHGEGDSWNVSISVSETETVASLDAVSDVEALFDAENAWNYDEDDEGGTTGLTLASVAGFAGASYVSAFVVANGISGFSASGLSLVVTPSSGSSSVWSCTSCAGPMSGSRYQCIFDGGSRTVPSGTSTAIVQRGSYRSEAISFTAS